MENGTIWGHGAYLGPDFSAEYLHTLALDAEKIVAERHGFVMQAALPANQRLIVNAEVARLLKQNRYDPASKTLTFTDAEAASYRRQIGLWAKYFNDPQKDGGLPHDYIRDPAQLRQLTSFFAWAAWASVADRPGRNYSYTNNFPYDPAVGNATDERRRAMERTQPDHAARCDCRGAVRVRAVRLPRMAPAARACASEDAARRGDAEPARDDQVLRRRRAALSRAGAGRRRYSALPRQRRQLLRNRSLGDSAEPDPAHVASAARNFLDRGIVRRGRTIPGAIDWRQ